MLWKTGAASGDYDEEYDLEFEIVGSGLATTTFNHRIASHLRLSTGISMRIFSICSLHGL